MDYIKFLEQSGKKIIIADRVSVGNALRRRANIKEGIFTVNAVTKSVYDIAKELVENHLAILGEYDGTGEIDSESASLILSNIVRKKGLSFINEDCLTVYTLQQLYNSITTLRMFEHNESYEKNPSKRISELKELIYEYETYLKNNHLYDRPLILKTALEILGDIETKKNDGLGFEYYLPWLEEARLGTLETNRLTGIEERLIKRILELCPGKEIDNITFLPEGGYEAFKSNDNIKRSYFKAYGAVNEIDYVIKQILRLQEEKVNLDRINILYTASDYENFLIGCLDMARVPYVMDGGIKAVNTGIVQMMLKILEWADNEGNYEYLSPVILNNILTFTNVIGEEENITCNPNTEYINASGKIGWGFERYKAYYEEISQEEDKVSVKIFAKFLSDMADIFAGKEVADIYSALIDFIKKYTNKKNPERVSLIAPLSSQIDVFRFLDTEGLDLKTKIEYIRGFLNSLKVEQTGVQGPYVNVAKFDTFRVIERDYNFIIGMSAAKSSVKSVNSAILSDEDMEEYLTGNNLPMSKNANQLRITRMQQTLETIDSGSIVMGYSYYDTVSLRENCASVFFLDLCPDEAEAENISAYDLYNMEFNPEKPDTYESWIKEWTKKVQEDERKREAEKQKELNNTENETGEDEKKKEICTYMSASQLQELLSCPLKYYYHCVRKIKTTDPVRRLPYQWLPANEKGNLYHHTYQRYMEKYFPPAKSITKDWDDIADTNNLRAEFDKEIERLKKDVPAPSDYIVYRETEENWDNLLAYIKNLHNEWFEDSRNGKNWLVLGCELDFEKDIRKEYEKDGETKYDNLLVYEDILCDYPYKIVFARGSIDRLDGYVDDNKILNLRITDYKTGSVSKKRSEIEENEWIQHHVYAMAAIAYVNDTENIKMLCEKFGVDEIKGLNFESIVYSFPTEISTYLMSKKKADMEVDVLIKNGDDALCNNMFDKNVSINIASDAGNSEESNTALSDNEETETEDLGCIAQLTQDDNNKMLWNVTFSDEVRDILSSVEGRSQLKQKNRTELTEEEATSQNRELDMKINLDIEKYIRKKVDNILENSSFVSTYEGALDEYCRYCNYYEICRKHAGNKVFVGFDSDTDDGDDADKINEKGSMIE